MADMTPKEVDDMFKLLSGLRKNVQDWRKLKCLDSVDLNFHTGHEGTHHSMSNGIFLVVREALINDKKKQLREQRDALSALGIDANSEMPEELR